MRSLRSVTPSFDAVIDSRSFFLCDVGWCRFDTAPVRDRRTNRQTDTKTHGKLQTF